MLTFPSLFVGFYDSCSPLPREPRFARLSKNYNTLSEALKAPLARADA